MRRFHRIINHLMHGREQGEHFIIIGYLEKDDDCLLRYVYTDDLDLPRAAQIAHFWSSTTIANVHPMPTGIM